MTDVQHETRPLLASDQHNLNHATRNRIAGTDGHSTTAAYRLRRFLQWFLASKYGHYFVIILVSLDVAGIFADFLISLHICEHAGEDLKVWEGISTGLDVMSLVFSCLFVVELLGSIYAFGLRYFESKFHCFDALSIIASFCVDVFAHGQAEEAGSLIIVLRLFRVFKIIEESSTVAEESLGELQERIMELEKENKTLRRRRIENYDSSNVDGV